jgi:hypothetical protein
MGGSGNYWATPSVTPSKYFIVKVILLSGRSPDMCGVVQVLSGEEFSAFLRAYFRGF